MIDYKTYRAQISLKYNYDVDETIAFILFVLQEEQQAFFKVQSKNLYAATTKINDSTHSLALNHDHPNWQSFWFGMGKLGVPLIIAILISSFFYWNYLNDEKEKDKLPSKYIFYRDYFDQSLKIGPKKSMVEYLNKNPMPQ